MCKTRNIKHTHTHTKTSTQRLSFEKKTFTTITGFGRGMRGTPYWGQSRVQADVPGSCRVPHLCEDVVVTPRSDRNPQ